MTSPGLQSDMPVFLLGDLPDYPFPHSFSQNWQTPCKLSIAEDGSISMPYPGRGRGCFSLIHANDDTNFTRVCQLWGLTPGEQKVHYSNA